MHQSPSDELKAPHNHASVKDSTPHLDSTVLTSDRVCDALERNDPITDVFRYDGGHHFIARDPSESCIMGGHLKGFPMVPGVVLKCMFLNLLNQSKRVHGGDCGIRIEYGKPALPGDGVRASLNMVGLEHEDGAPCIEIAALPDYANNVDPKLYDPSREIDMDTSTLDRKLLQCGKFRFASGAQFIRDRLEKDPGPGDIFQGHCAIAENFPFTVDIAGQGQYVHPALIEEMVAQTAAVAFTQQIGDVAGEDGQALRKGRTMTFKRSDCRFTGKPLAPGSVLRVVGRVSEVNLLERVAAFEYVAVDKKGEEILRGEIQGNIVPLMTLRFLFKNRGASETQ